MTTYTQFAPTAAAPFEFRPTLDGQEYNCTVTWNVFGQRWYLNIFTLQGALVLSTALIASPPPAVPPARSTDINLVALYFQTSTLVFRDSTQQFEVNP